MKKQNITYLLISIVFVALIIGAIFLFLPKSATKNIAIYDEEDILVSYGNDLKFQTFLSDHIGQIVKINSRFTFDLAKQENQLIHHACNLDLFINQVTQAPAQLANTPFSLPKIVAEIDKQQWQHYHATETFSESMVNAVDCNQHVRLVLKQPEETKFSYGGTGFIALPIEGKFEVKQNVMLAGEVEFILTQI